MSDATARFGLAMLVPGQAQKELTHNEALATLDVAVQACVASLGLETPPVGPAPGACWIVGATPNGAWAGQAGKIAAWTVGGWRFVAPTPGFVAWVIDQGAQARFVDDAWTLSTPDDPIADPAGGETVDSQARAAIAAILAALRHHNLLQTA